MLSRRVALCLLAALAAAGSRAASAGGEAPRPPPEPPRENASYVPDDDEGMKKAWKAVETAAAAKDWPAAVRALQKIAEGPREALVVVSEGRVYEGAATVAHHRVLRLGAAALAAYEQDFGPRAREALAAAAAALSEARLAEIVERWLPASEARAAAWYWASMYPDWRPPWAARNGGSSETSGFTSRSIRRSAMPAR